MYDINIVIVNFKMKEDVVKCLGSLFHDCVGDGLQLNTVIIDNASGDGLEAVLKEKFPLVRYAQLPKNVGFGAAQNIGLKSAEAKYHFILNPDTLFPPGGHAIKKLFDFMGQNPKIGMIGPKMLYPDGTLQLSCYRFPRLLQPVFSRTRFGARGVGKKINDEGTMKDFDHNQNRAVDWIMGSAMFARATALNQVGLFDDRFFMYYEDSDLCRRFWEAGWPVFYVHDIVLQHTHGRGSAKVPGVLRAILKNKLARIHIISGIKYMWKWRGNHKYYATRLP